MRQRQSKPSATQWNRSNYSLEPPEMGAPFCVSPVRQDRALALGRFAPAARARMRTALFCSARNTVGLRRNHCTKSLDLSAPKSLPLCLLPAQAHK